MKKSIVVVLVLTSLILVGAGCSCRHSETPKNVQFEFVGCLEKIKEIQWDYWFMVNDIKGTDITSEILTDFCDAESIEMDFERYTYIVSDGYELVDIYYTSTDVKGRFSAAPKYYGYATLQKSNDAMVYIYRISVDTPVVKDMHAHFEDDYRTTVLP